MVCVALWMKLRVRAFPTSGKVSPTDTDLLGFQSSLELLKKKENVCVLVSMYGAREGQWGPALLFSLIPLR